MALHPKKMLILFILEILRKYSDEEHPLKQKDIVDYLHRDYDMIVDRKAIQRNLMDLIECKVYNIEYSEINRKKGAGKTEEENAPIVTDIYIQPEITDGELRLLVDSILFSPNIPAGQAMEIIDHLRNSTSKYKAERLKQVHLVKTLYRTTASDTFLKIEELQQIMERNHKASFRLKSYSADKKMYTPDAEPVQVSPYYLVAVKGYYYLIGQQDGEKNLRNYRIDQIADVYEVKEGKVPIIETELSRIGLDGYIGSHPFMSSGATEKVTLRIDKDYLGLAIDSFGNSCQVTHETESEYEMTVTTNAQDMYLWALHHVDGATVLEPQELRLKIARTARRMSSRYCMTDEERYDRAIEFARKNGMLSLTGFDLKGKNEYKDFTNLTFVEIMHCKNCDISFLRNQKSLNHLRLHMQPVRDLQFLQGIENLKELRLWKTGIRSLDDLRSMSSLTTLVLHEPGLDDINTLYSLPLKLLRISDLNASSLDMNRLRDNGVEIQIMHYESAC